MDATNAPVTPGIERAEHRPPAPPDANVIRELSAITDGLAHEIRNPLSTLKVNLQLLAEDWRELGRQDQAAADVVRRGLNRVERMLREVDRLARIMDDFLRFAGRHELQREPSDLNAFAAELADFFAPQARAQGVMMRTLFTDQPIPVAIDVNLLKQAVLNLLLNALHAMPNGGELILRTHVLDRGHACLEVTDTGCGIAPQDVERIFEAYYSTRTGGTGLGLPTARRIVNEHGGWIDVHSEPGRGSSFRIVLPGGQT